MPKFCNNIIYKTLNYLIISLGYFIFLSNNPKLSSEEVLSLYYRKDVIEKHFDQFKNELEFKRVRTYSEKTTEGKIFVGFLALILRSYMLNVIKNNEATKHLTFEKVMIELKKIRFATYENGEKDLLPLTKLQKTILSTFTIEKEKLFKSDISKFS